MGMSIYTCNGVLLICLLLMASIPISVKPSIHMLDVGQGDALLFQEQGTQILIDGGPGADVLMRLSEEMPEFDRTIEVVVATHFDRDHIEGLSHVLHTYDVGMVLMPFHTATTSSGKKQFIDILQEKNIPYRYAWYGQKIRTKSFTFRVLSPISGERWRALSKNKSNNASVMVRADVLPSRDTQLSFLLTGDAEANLETYALSTIVPEAFDVDILKVGHHGSNTSSSTPFIFSASPTASLISVGEKNTYGHPTREVLSRLADSRIFRTDRMGSVSFTFDGRGWRVLCRGKMNLPFSQELCIKK